MSGSELTNDVVVSLTQSLTRAGLQAIVTPNITSFGDGQMDPGCAIRFVNASPAVVKFWWVAHAVPTFHLHCCYIKTNNYSGCITDWNV